MEDRGHRATAPAKSCRGVGKVQSGRAREQTTSRADDPTLALLVTLNAVLGGSLLTVVVIIGTTQ